MTLAPQISVDLTTPLGAYMRLRGLGRASFLLESVERGRLGRHSFVGFGSRLCALDEAEGCGAPVIGYVAYDHAAVVEPSVPLPAEGAGFPESRFVVADALLRFDHAAGVAHLLAGDRDRVAEALEDTLPSQVAQSHEVHSLRRFPDRATYESGVRAAKEHIRRGDAFQIVLSQRAERPTWASALDL